MLRSFFSAMMAAAMLKILNPLHTGKLVLFQVRYESTWRSFDVIFFVLLGVLGGLFGCFLIRTNLKIVAMRKQSRLNMRPVQEACAVALVTAVISFCNNFLFISSGSLISALFSECKPRANGGGGYSSPASADSEVPLLCNESFALSNIALLVVAAVAKTALTAVTFGTRVPCGIFIPVVAVGACIGRAVGIAVAWLQSGFPSVLAIRGCVPDAATASLFSFTCVQPGPYALLGAAAFLAGVTRMTVSLVVIMFEVTGALDYILPIMITVMVAKFVGDAFSRESIYDGLIRLNGYPYLSPQEEYRQNLDAADVMIAAAELHVLAAQTATVGSLGHLLDTTDVSGFPVVSSMDTMDAIGYISRRELRFALHEARYTRPFISNATRCSCAPPEIGADLAADGITDRGGEYALSRDNELFREEGYAAANNNNNYSYYRAASGGPDHPSGARHAFGQVNVESGCLFGASDTRTLDLRPWIDPAPITIVPSYQMETTIELFKKMGLRYILVTQNGRLHGLITKKDILRHLGRIFDSQKRTRDNVITDRLVG